MSQTADSPEDPALARPFYRLLGLRSEPVAEEGRSLVRLESREELTNSRGDIHGGAVASLLDAAMGVAVRTILPPGGGATTVSLTVNYVAPGRDVVLARGRVVRAGRTLASLEATAEGADGEPVAHAVGTMRIIAPRGA